MGLSRKPPPQSRIRPSILTGMPTISNRTRRLLRVLFEFVPGGTRMQEWMSRQPFPPAELARMRADIQSAGNSIQATAPRTWRVNAPIDLTATEDFRVRVTVPPGTELRYEHRRHQVFHEWWGRQDLINHRFALPDGRLVDYLESWVDLDDDDVGLRCDRPFPPSEIEAVDLQPVRG
jgi:hypothetical protein